MFGMAWRLLHVTIVRVIRDKGVIRLEKIMLVGTFIKRLDNQWGMKTFGKAHRNG